MAKINLSLWPRCIIKTIMAKCDAMKCCTSFKDEKKVPFESLKLLPQNLSANFIKHIPKALVDNQNTGCSFQVGFAKYLKHMHLIFLLLQPKADSLVDLFYHNPLVNLIQTDRFYSTMLELLFLSSSNQIIAFPNKGSVPLTLNYAAFQRIASSE